MPIATQRKLYVSAEKTAQPTPLALGFGVEFTGVHISRTMMLDELSLLLERVSVNAKAEAYGWRNVEPIL